VITRALSRAREDRFESAAAMRDAVRAIPGERKPAHLSDAVESKDEPRDTELSPVPAPARESSPAREGGSAADASRPKGAKKKKKKKARVGPGGRPEVTIAKTVAHDATPRTASAHDSAATPAVTPWTYGLVGLLVLMIGGFVYLVASSGGGEEPIANEGHDSVPPVSTPPDEPLRVQPVEPVPARPAARPPAPGQAPAEFDVVLETTKGDIRVHVTRAWAPNGADRFYELVRAGYFDDVAFFRVIEGFMAQVGMSGDPATNARWEDRPIADDPVRQRNTPGMVTFAATARPNSRTTQFFINLGDNSRLDDMGFAPFGRTTDLEVVRSLYAGYGEGAPRGRGPEQGRIGAEGNAYLRRDFPLLDYVRRARIVE
jgi:peptidyl-prolyl cis-trans isomerase A (cyclophilin A)